MNVELTLESRDYPTSEELMTTILPVNHVFDTIIEYELQNFNVDNPECKKAWETLREIYQKVLYQDPVWHFFYEGSFSLLRFSKCFEAEVTSLLCKRNVQFVNKSVWKDEQETTAKYQKIFTSLFHDFSVLALESPYEEIEALADRVFHCFMNHQWYKMYPYRARHGAAMWEGSFLAVQALNRIAYCQYWQGVADEYHKHPKSQ